MQQPELYCIAVGCNSSALVNTGEHTPVLWARTVHLSGSPMCLCLLADMYWNCHSGIIPKYSQVVVN